MTRRVCRCDLRCVPVPHSSYPELPIPSSPVPGNPTFCLFWTFNINEIIEYVILCQGILTELNVFKVHPRCGTCQYFIRFHS